MFVKINNFTNEAYHLKKNLKKQSLLFISEKSLEIDINKVQQQILYVIIN